MATAKKAGAAAPASTSTYLVIDPLDHDGELYAIGDEVELSDTRAGPLMGLAVKLKSASQPAG